MWRGFLLIFFIFGALAHSWAQPYNTMYENWLELFSILFLIVVLHLNPDGSEPGWSWFVIILVLVMIIVFIFVMRKVKGKESEELEVLARDDLDVRMLDAVQGTWKFVFKEHVAGQSKDEEAKYSMYLKLDYRATAVPVGDDESRAENLAKAAKAAQGAAGQPAVEYEEKVYSAIIDGTIKRESDDSTVNSKIHRGGATEKEDDEGDRDDFGARVFGKVNGRIFPREKGFYLYIRWFRAIDKLSHDMTDMTGISRVYVKLANWLPAEPKDDGKNTTQSEMEIEMESEMVRMHLVDVTKGGVQQRPILEGDGETTMLTGDDEKNSLPIRDHLIGMRVDALPTYSDDATPTTSSKSRVLG